MFDPISGIDAAAVIDAAAESILVTTADLDAPGLSIIYVNPAFEKMTGWSSAEVIGKSPKILQGPNTNHQIFADLREKLQNGLSWEGCTLNYRKDGSEFWMEWSIVPLKDAQGETYQFVAVQRDVTARIDAELRLQTSQKAEQIAERARANLARYFPPKLVRTLADKDEPLGAVRRQYLAILFVDIVGFTKLSEAVEPELVIELLREIHVWMEKVIFKHDGSIEGYVGDAVLAIFGFPEVGDHDAGNALSCACELLDVARVWNKGRVENGLLPAGIGIGLQYGPVVLGDVGTEEFVEFTVIGDTVNTASRLQQATRAFQCDLVVGQDLVTAIENEKGRDQTRNLLSQLNYRGNFAIRGRERDVRVWTL